ncbi:MAG TPA: LamG-like jellyroll fold domain-containing protein [Terracidiphilus sp.]
MLPFKRTGPGVIVLVAACGLFLSANGKAAQPSASSSAGGPTIRIEKTSIWRFDRTDNINGLRTEVLGHPQVIDTRYGKAVHFNGVDDGLILPEHPLAGASTYTWEVIFRPDGGAFAQRFFHLQEQDPATHQDTGNRMLFEIRVVKGQWCLDSFASSGENHRALLNCKLLHPLGKWYVVTAVYDGKLLHNYVDGQLQGEGTLDLKPQMEGRSSVGVRINHKYFFKGAILMARMVPRALPPAQFWKLPPVVNKASGN